MEVIQIVKQKLKDIEIKTELSPFNILYLMYEDITRKEEMQSKILAGFLDPKENHGLSDIPLKIFLEMNFPENKFEIKENSNFSVFIERTVYPKNSSPRRIDILLEWNGMDMKKHAIIIENKLNWATNQKNQLNDYYNCLINENYEVEGIVYMPFSSKHQHSCKTDSANYVLSKTKDFDAEKIVKWLGKVIKSLENQKKETSSIFQYMNFIQCLISSKFIIMKALEVLEQLSQEEICKIENLAKLVSTIEWCEARFHKISSIIKKDFNENLKIEYKKWNDGRNYVQYYFIHYEFWLELWLSENNINLYIVSNNDIGEFINVSDYTFSNKQLDKNYYYHNSTIFCFNNDSYDALVEIVIRLLKEAEKIHHKKSQVLTRGVTNLGRMG